MSDRTRGRTQLPSLTCPEARLITARSHFVDRFVPDCETVLLPAKTVEGGALNFERGRVRLEAPMRPKRGLLKRRAVEEREVEGVLVDFRIRNPENWAHFLNNHLPILFALCEATDTPPGDCVLVLPEGAPSHILDAAELFGLTALATGDTVTGEGITFAAEPWTGIRPERRDWATGAEPQARLAAAGAREANPDLPDRVFLARRDTRTLENEAEVERLLTKRGFNRLYAEDLSPLDQFRLFEQAEAVVAIHGAGLAPLLYISPEARLRWLMELFPCGHMTDVYRVMAHQCGVRWIGVRGRIKPEHVTPAYKLDEPFLAYSLQSFEADTHAIARALDMIESQTG